MRERNRFGEIFVQLQRASDVARDAGDFHCVREPRAIMITGAVEENLRLVFEPSKGARMDHAITIALIVRTPFGRSLFVFASAGVAAELRVRPERLSLDLFQFFSRARHES